MQFFLSISVHDHCRRTSSSSSLEYNWMQYIFSFSRHTFLWIKCLYFRFSHDDVYLPSNYKTEVTTHRQKKIDKSLNWVDIELRVTSISLVVWHSCSEAINNSICMGTMHSINILFVIFTNTNHFVRALLRLLRQPRYSFDAWKYEYIFIHVQLKVTPF